MEDQLKKLNFSYNWNNKLNCKVYTTIRLYKEGKYYINQLLEVHLKDQFLHVARLHDNIKCPMDLLPNFTCFLDTGYCREETISIIKKMYKLKANDNPVMVIMLLVKNNSENR